MGTKMAPSYANLFMGFVEQDLLSRSAKKPLVWFRYIDDIFFIWTHGQEALDEFLQFCNNNKHGIIFEVTPESVSTTSIQASLSFGLALRIKRICSNVSDFKEHCRKLTMHLRKRGFKLGLIKDGIKKASLQT